MCCPASEYGAHAPMVLQSKPDPRVRAPDIDISGNNNDAMTAVVE
jgi:hypothetical protein